MEKGVKRREGNGRREREEREKAFCLEKGDKENGKRRMKRKKYKETLKRSRMR